MPSFPLASQGIVFILDNAVHACIQINRGLMEQFGEVVLTDILSPQAVEEQFQAAFNQNKTPLVITDSIGSMGGVAPVALLMDMAEKYKGYVYFDDAHGTSVYGKYGAGYVLQALDHVFHPRLILTSSLSKGYGANSGVIVLPTEADEQMVKRHATTYLFGNPTPVAAIVAAIASAIIHLSGEIHDLQNQLQENIRYFDSLIQQHVNIINRDTAAPVRGIFVGDEFKAIECTTLLRQSGFAVTAAMYPTVAKGESMLRVALSSAHSKAQIEALCERIKHCSHQIINPEKTHAL
jgi:7-keto-8-aminopelargonate synthetase-like enzyme